MAVTTTTSPLAHTSNATFQAWYNEVINALLGLGVTQTTDTGQIGATASNPAINTSAGYTIWKFNDSLQATAPIFFKLEFGTGATAGYPQMWITIGTSSNGSGTIGGIVGTRIAVCANQVLKSTTANSTSFFVYNTTYGVLGMVFKTGGVSVAADPGLAYGGFYIFRGSTTAGAANTDASMLIANSDNATGTTVDGVGAQSGWMQCISYGNTTVYPTTVANGGYWMTYPPFLVNASLGSISQVYPGFYMSPAITMSGVLGIVAVANVPYFAMFTTTLVGSTSITMLNAGGMFGGVSLGGPGTTTSPYSGTVGEQAATDFGVAILWE